MTGFIITYTKINPKKPKPFVWVINLKSNKMYTEQLLVKLLPQDKQLLVDKAHELRLPVSTYARTLLLKDHD